MRTIIVLIMTVCIFLDLVSVVSLENVFSSTWVSNIQISLTVKIDSDDQMFADWDKITKAWNEMIAAIKRPVRPRRLGFIARRKTTKSSTPLFSYETGVVELTSAIVPTRKLPLAWRTHAHADKELSMPKKGVSIEMPPQVKKIRFHEEDAVTPDSQRVKLPYIEQPVWKTIEEWKRMQWPNFVKILRNENVNEDSETLIASKDKLTYMNEEDNLGMLFFV